MTVDEWEKRDCTLPLWQFLKKVHYYTELVKIYVVIGDAWLDNDKYAKRRPSDFWLTENACKGIFHNDTSEIERLLKYYANAPVWNICGEFTTEPFYNNHYTHKRELMEGRHITSCITARVHFRDIREAYYRERADIKRQKRYEYARKQKETKLT